VLGYTKTGGNTDNSAGNLLFHAAHVMGDWRLLFGVDGLYGSTRGETTAQAWSAYLQGNYSITRKVYWYIGGRYDDDRFSGFAYQAAVKSGFGYKFIDTDATKLTAQLGAGYRRLRPEILVKDDIGGVVSRTEQPEESDAILDAGVAFEHNFNTSTKLLAAVTMQSGKENTLTNASVALQVKMNARLALSAGYRLIDNSSPPPGSGRRDTLTTLGLVYELKNDKLPPE
jgi:putative salt-induced outer membrane protein